MKRSFKISLTMVGVSILTACGGGSDDPVDIYVGNWKSACFPYRGNDGNTYFKTQSLSLTKASATSLNGTHHNTVAHSDPACKNVLGDIIGSASLTIQLGEKANVLGAEVDKVSIASPTATYPGYMTVNAAKLFIVATATPDAIPTSWGKASPHTRIESKQAVAAPLSKDSGIKDHLAPENSLDAYSR